MMMRCGYDEKIDKHLWKATTATLENSWNRKLKGLEKNQEITSALYNKLRPTGSQLPRIYGLPKT